MSMPPYLTSPLMINQRKSSAQEWQQKKIKVQDRTKTKKQKNPKQRNLEFHIREVFLLVKIYHNIMQSLKERWKFNTWSVYRWVLLFTGKYGKKEKRENHASFPPAFWGKHISCAGKGWGGLCCSPIPSHIILPESKWTSSTHAKIIMKDFLRPYSLVKTLSAVPPSTSILFRSGFLPLSPFFQLLHLPSSCSLPPFLIIW